MRFQTVLVVEDDDLLRENLADLLRLEGYEVLTAANGSEGLRKHTETLVDLVVTDVMMPVMDGVEMVDNLRALRPELPVVFMSGYLGSPLMEHNLLQRIQSLCCPLIAKPYKADQMLTAVRTSLEYGTA